MNDEITPAQLSKELKLEAPIMLIDVREVWERGIAKLPDHLHIPLSEFAVPTIDNNDKTKIVIYCHHGVRSRYVTDYFKELGWQGVYNLTGGIDRWSIEVDKTVARY